MKICILLSFLSFGILAGCTSESSQINVSTNTADTIVAMGKYEGVMPCADCDGIATTLSLNGDGTYDLTTTYQDTVNDVSKDELTYTNSGIYERNDAMVKVITPSSGEILLFKVLDDNKLLRVSEDGTEPMPELYENYILKKVQ